MKNKRVIRIKDKQAGTFTTVPNQLINHKDLTAFDKIFLMSILSDSDADFSFNKTTYANRFCCSPDKIGTSIKRLCKAGYMKQTKDEMKFNYWHYTISEYGNLNTTSPEPIQLEVEQPIQDEPVIESAIDIVEYIPTIQAELDKRTTEKIDIDSVWDCFLDASEAGKITNANQLSIKNINVVINRYIIKNLSLQECETIIKDKMNGGTIAQRSETVTIVKQWFTVNGSIATEDEIRSKTFKTHNGVKTNNRVIDQRYND